MARRFSIILISLGVWIAGSCPAAAQSVSSVSQSGITFSFDRSYTAGTFANGDFWVLGPVQITSIAPDYDGTHHGWEVNPVFSGSQGFDSRCGSFDAALVPSLPYTAQPGASIVKAVSGFLDDPSPRPALARAVVLTVVDSVPSGNGADVFRPPYVGTDKPQFSVASLRTDLLPSFAPVSDMPELSWVVERFSPLQLDHKGGAVGRCLHPADHMPDYGGDIGRDNGDGALRLMMSESVSEKRAAIVAYLQMGIDAYYSVLTGQTWPNGGGHRPGHVIPLVLAAVLLDNDSMKNTVRDIDFFHEDRGVVAPPGLSTPLYGFPQGEGTDLNEQRYWDTVVSNTGFKSRPDPYHVIDGGHSPGGGYQYCCVTQPWKGQVLAAHLMPELQTVWKNENLFRYIDRWVNQGSWAQPDPCAPADGRCSGGPNNGARCTTSSNNCGEAACALSMDNYGITFGPDGQGGCIKDTDPSDGIGRFTGRHLIHPDGGYRSSSFQRALWNAYRGSSCYDGRCDPLESAEYCPNDCGGTRPRAPENLIRVD